MWIKCTMPLRYNNGRLIFFFFNFSSLDCKTFNPIQKEKNLVFSNSGILIKVFERWKLKLFSCLFFLNQVGRNLKLYVLSSQQNCASANALYKYDAKSVTSDWFWTKWARCISFAALDESKGNYIRATRNIQSVLFYTIRETRQEIIPTDPSTKFRSRSLRGLCAFAV